MNIPTLVIEPTVEQPIGTEIIFTAAEQSALYFFIHNRIDLCFYLVDRLVDRKEFSVPLAKTLVTTIKKIYQNPSYANGEAWTEDRNKDKRVDHLVGLVDKFHPQGKITRANRHFIEAIQRNINLVQVFQDSTEGRALIAEPPLFNDRRCLKTPGDLFYNNNDQLARTIEDKQLTGDEVQQLLVMNMTYQHVIAGGQHVVVSKKKNELEGHCYCFERAQTFHLSFKKSPKIAGMNAGKAWLAWRSNNFFPHGFCYTPFCDNNPYATKQQNEKQALSAAVFATFNLFQKYPAYPMSGDVSLIIEHIRTVLCHDDPKAWNYLIHWLAHLFQKPQEKPTVAILFKSVEGTGKSSLFRLLKKMLGINMLQVNGHNQITNRFNSQLCNRLLIAGEEVDLTQKTIFDLVKGLISEQTINFELKGIESQTMTSYARYMFAGNHNHLLNAGVRERRFLVINPSTSKINDRYYWKMLNKFIDEDGSNFFLEYLMSLDLTYFSPYQAPMTQGLIDEKLMSLNPLEEFFYIQLSHESPFNGYQRIVTKELVNDYLFWYKEKFKFKNMITTPGAYASIGRLMAQLGLIKLGRSGRGLGSYYEFEDKAQLKHNFAELFGHSVEEFFHE